MPFSTEAIYSYLDRRLSKRFNASLEMSVEAKVGLLSHKCKKDGIIINTCDAGLMCALPQLPQHIHHPVKITIFTDKNENEFLAKLVWRKISKQGYLYGFNLLLPTCTNHDLMAIPNSAFITPVKDRRCKQRRLTKQQNLPNAERRKAERRTERFEAVQHEIISPFISKLYKKGINCLVTGATGFIGSHLVNALIKQGYFVTAVARNPKPDIQRLWNGNVKLIYTDLSQQSNSIQDALKGIDIVVLRKSVETRIFCNAATERNFENLANS